MIVFIFDVNLFVEASGINSNNPKLSYGKLKHSNPMMLT